MPRDDMDRLLAAWFEEDARGAAPESMVDAALDRSAATPRRPSGLLLTKRWPSMISTLRLRFVPVPRPAMLLIVLALIVALAAAALYVGSHQRPAPFGPARNGFLSMTSDGDIYVANADGSGRRALTSGPAVDEWPTFSPDGTLVAFGSRPTSGPDQLIVVSVAGGHQTVIDTEDAAQDANPGAPAMLSWSPDSRHLAYVRNVRTEDNVGAFGELAVADVVTGNVVPIADTSTDVADPAWSPDGRTIAFRRFNGAHSVAQLRLIEADGTNERAAYIQPGDPAAFGAPQWSPDSSRLVVYGGVYPHQVYVVSTDAKTEPLAIGPGLGDEFYPTWSNDGSRIAWEIGQPSTAQVLVYMSKADGTGVKQLDVPDVTATTLMWSPDDKYLYGTMGYAAGIVVIPTDGVSAVRTIKAPNTDSNGNWQRLGPCLFGVICGS